MTGDVAGAAQALSLLSVADADLPYVERIRNGDTEAFGPLWTKYEQALFQFFMKRTSDRQEAEDLASETLFAALQSIPQFRGMTLGCASENRNTGCTFRTYLQSIAKHKLAHWIRRKRTRNEVRVEDVAMSPHGDPVLTRSESALASSLVSDDNPLDAVLHTEQKEMACFALASLDSPAQFKVVLLHYFAGMTHQDIAKVLTTRSETINTRLQDGRKALRRHYRHLDDAPVDL